MTDLQAEYDRVSGELTKLRAAEKSLASIVEGGPLEAVASGRGRILNPNGTQWGLQPQPAPRVNRTGFADRLRCGPQLPAGRAGGGRSLPDW
jgi:hypothetical protein